MSLKSVLSVFIAALLFVPESYGLDKENVVGGTPAHDLQFKYQVAIYRDRLNACGGSIIDDTLILTAAHCVIDIEDYFYEETFKVVAGVTDLNDQSNNRIEVGVKRIYVPRTYDIHLSIDDIAVLRLTESLKVKENPQLSILRLAEGYISFADREATIAGFGYDWAVIENGVDGKEREIGSSTTDRMSYIKVKVLKNKDCEEPRFPDHDSKKFKAASRKKICAKAYDASKAKRQMGVCTGDSGSPLVYDNLAIGVLSESPMGCDETERPAVYTRISEYKEFLKKAKKDDVCRHIRFADIPKEKQLPLSRGKQFWKFF